MLLTTDEVLKIADERLDFSFNGNFYASPEYIIEFAYEVIRAEKQKGGTDHSLPIL